MDFSDLKKKQRYTFYYETQEGLKQHFRANFLGVVHDRQYTTLVINKYDSEFVFHHPNSVVFYMDPNRIYKIETLVDVLEHTKCKIPDDVLREINGFY